MRKSSSFTHQDVTGYKYGSWPFGEPQMYSHIYYVDGLLIDTGHVHMRREICDTLSGLPVEQMLVTHHHEDHSGNIAAVNQFFNCPVFASAECAEIMKSPPAISPAQYLTWGKYDAFSDLKIVGEEIKTQKYTFQVIPIPGHATDMIALYEKENGWLFSADLYVHHRIKYFMRSESMIQQIESIKKILSLDFDKMFCSHNPQLDKNPKLLLTKKLNHFEELYEEISGLFHKGMNANQIVKSIPRIDDRQIKWMSLGALSRINMIKAVIRDEKAKE